MALVRQFLLRLLSLFRQGRAEQDLAREVRSHLELLEEKFLAEGLAPEDARLAARRAFGGVDQAKERHRDARSFRWLDDLQRDVRYAIRSLRRSPAFTTAAVLTLAIGIGATTAIYSVVDNVLLQPLPFQDSERLVRIIENDRPRSILPTTYQEYLEWRARTTTLSGLIAVTFNPQALMMTSKGALRFSGGLISSNYFNVLGGQAMLGRTILPADDANPDVMVLNYETWQRHFQSDRDIVGKTLELRSGTSSASRLLTVVGVLQEGVPELGVFDFYTPIVLAPNARPFTVSPLIGRLKDGVSVEAASAEADAIGGALRPPRPESAPPLTRPRIEARRLKDDMVSGLQPALRVFLAAVIVVLLIVCANVANLLLARGTARRREIAVRLAIGAGRGRIVRQILTECVVLAAVGGVLGAVLGAGGVALVKELATVEAEGVFRLVFGSTVLTRADEVTVSVRVLLTALALAAITSVVFGILPALQLSRTNHLQAMGSRGGGKGRTEARVRAGLVVGQLVMATVLLVGAGLLAHSFLNLSQVEKGYDPSKALAFQVVLPPEYATARKVETIETILSRLRAVPEVKAAGFAYAGVLLSIENTVGTFVPPGRSLEEFVADTAKPRLKALSGGYFEAMRMRLLDGRAIDGRDGPAATPSVVLNRTIARRFFGDGNPVGQTLAWHGAAAAQNHNANNAMPRPPVQVQIVGVVEDVRQGAVAREAYAEIFMDYRQVLTITRSWGFPPAGQEALALGFMSFGVRTEGDPRAVIPAVRRTVGEVDANAGIDAIQPMATLVGNSVARQRFYAVLLGIFAGVAGLLAAIGIYGVLGYSVIERTQEIGVRMALGAERRQVLALVMRRGLVLTSAGIIAGLAGAFAGARYLQSMLFGIEPRDPSTFIAVAAMFAVVAAVASYLPARRATKVDPMVALRVD